ncbi:uncharacterized protein DUF937 [Nonomuraea polychroma]|uniref:Uncharacterized protein DUF937 n=1 Tax=Nonomuraea polychroma TaxID=46176 RepID=A0A438MCN4_9ACTN|nr:DUF937 domain-containing protein [Nonomuraea polychroma]RVX43476.1 uncharacterized protein DUF937 [Nonomuraea polychroma]
MTLHDELIEQLGEPGLDEVAGMLGTDPTQARDVVRAVTGIIVGGLARNAQHPDGAEALRAALEDHVDADPFNGDVASLTRDGHSILAHVLGGQGTEQAAAGLARLVGIDTGAVMKLLPLIAPMVMFLLADRAARLDMDARDVAGLLDRERTAVSGGLGEALDGLLANIFGSAVPGWPYVGRELAADRSYGAHGELEPGPSGEADPGEPAPGRSNPDW